jgi:hypothetical protein
MLYGLIYGDVSMLPSSGGGGTGLDGGNDVAEIQSLRILLIFCSVLMMCVFLITKVRPASAPPMLQTRLHAARVPVMRGVGLGG